MSTLVQFALAPVPGTVVVTVVLVARGVGWMRRHRPLANRRFMARYQATYAAAGRSDLRPGSSGGSGDNTAAAAPYPESEGLQRLADLRDAGGWMFTVQDVVVTGVRPWPDGSADLLVVRDFRAAQARRTNPAGGVVWRQEGDPGVVVDGLLKLRAPDDPDAPADVIGASPDIWTSG